MALQRFKDPMTTNSMTGSFSSMLDRFFNESLHTRSLMANFTPPVDTAETETGYEIEVSLPGLKKEEIQLDFQDGQLTVSGERRFASEQQNRKYHLVESSYGSFSRTFYLPDTINPEGIEADFEDGMLRIVVPKDVRKTTKHQILIKGSKRPETGNEPQQEK